MNNITHPMRLMIRPFTPSDLDSIYDIERRSFPHPWSRFAFRLTYSRNPHGFLVAVADEKVVGYVIAEKMMYREPPGSKMKRSAHLLNIAVDPEFRHRGIGKALMETITTYLRGEGVNGIWLEVRASNLVARSFYSRMGFEERGRRARYYLDEDAVVMMKEL